MTQCPYCQSEVPSDSPVFLLDSLRKWVESKGGWHVFESDHDTYGYAVNKVFNINGIAAKVVAKKTDYDRGDIDSDYYDGLPQGTTFDTYVVIQYGESFFKKTGTGDSYGTVSWDGELLPVVPKIKTVEVYEFNG